jgi:hypothetical protein
MIGIPTLGTQRLKNRVLVIDSPRRHVSLD